MSSSWTFFDGEWQTGNVPLIGSTTQAVWLASIVFDGARAFDGLAPDLDLHAARAIDSASTSSGSIDRATPALVSMSAFSK